MTEHKSLEGDDRYTLGDVLGRGGFSTVLKGFDTQHKKPVAIKSIDICSMSKEEMSNVEQEIELIKSLQHSHIISFYDSKFTSNYIYMILEYADRGSLRQLYQNYGKFSEFEVVYCVRQALLGLKYLHDHEIAHRDIKCANLLLNNHGIIKLADFGSSKRFNSITKSITNGLKGTPNWMAPEVIRGETSTDGWIRADIWSIGCTICEMITANIPFHEYDNSMTAMFRIAHGEVPSIQNNTMSDELMTIMLSCCSLEPSKRPSTSELIVQSIFNTFINEIDDTAKFLKIISNKTDVSTTTIENVTEEPATEATNIDDEYADEMFDVYSDNCNEDDTNSDLNSYKSIEIIRPKVSTKSPNKLSYASQKENLFRHAPERLSTSPLITMNVYLSPRPLANRPLAPLSSEKTTLSRNIAPNVQPISLNFHTLQDVKYESQIPPLKLNKVTKLKLSTSLNREVKPSTGRNGSEKKNGQSKVSSKLRCRSAGLITLASIDSSQLSSQQQSKRKIKSAPIVVSKSTNLLPINTKKQ